MRLLLPCIFFVIIGVLSVYIPINLVFSDESRILINNSSPIIRYSPVLFCVYFSLLMFLTPIFLYFEVLPLNYFNASEYIKNRSDFIIITLTIPLWFLLYIILTNLGMSNLVFSFFVLLIIIKYISSIRFIIKAKKNHNSS